LGSDEQHQRQTKKEIWISKKILLMTRTEFNQWLDKVERYLTNSYREQLGDTEKASFTAQDAISDWHNNLRKYFEEGKTPLEAALQIKPGL
jgi:hypothetical protein